MKRLCLFLVFEIVLLTGLVAQNKNTAPPEVIKVKKYNIEKEIQNGSLTFLKGCFWTETVHQKYKTISTTHASPDALIGRRGIIFIENIKKQKPDGSIQHLPSKKLIIE